jgi:gas vesicle protein
MQGLVKFLVGGLAGTAVGLVVGGLMAPQRGEELQAETRRRLAAAQEAGDDAERLTKSALEERFRQRVNDPKAFSPAADTPVGHTR